MKLIELLSFWWKPTSEKAIVLIIHVSPQMTKQDLRDAWQYLKAVEENVAL